MTRSVASSTLAVPILFLVVCLAAPAVAGGRDVAAGDSHTCAVSREGAVKCWGSNAFGQLGNGSTVDSLTPVKATGLAIGATMVTAGTSHSCAVTAAGGVKCWGQNAYGQLGNGGSTTRTVPTDVVGLTTGAASVAGGLHHTCALTTAGGVKCWGSNPAGELGDGTTTNRSTPVDVVGLTSGVAAIAAGASYSCAVTTGGGMKCWGANGYGQLGDGTTTSQPTPVDVSGLASGVASIGAGYSHTCAVTIDGGMKCWGANGNGQLGDGTMNARGTPAAVTGLGSGISAAALGSLHTCALTTAGRVKCWGGNSFGQVGDGAIWNEPVPVDVTALLPDASAIAAGSYHSCAATSGGSFRCWGRNTLGQIGDGTRTLQLTALAVPELSAGALSVAAAATHSCAGTASGAWCWGANGVGQLGDGTTTRRTTAVEVTDLAGKSVARMSANATYTCAHDGNVLTCWGGYTESTAFTDGLSASAAGASHTCAMTAAGNVQCRGNNDYGQLGDGTYVSRAEWMAAALPASRARAVAAGSYHACAVVAPDAGSPDGGVLCWGRNDQGQLGDGSTAARPSPTAVAVLASGVKGLSGGGNHTCAFTTAGAVKCWGANSNGQLGDGTKTQRLTPVDVSVGTVAALAAGLSHTCALTTAGSVWCWGYNGYGQLGDGTRTDRSSPTAVLGLSSDVVAIAAGWFHTCAITGSGAVKCWGSNENGEVGSGAPGQRVTPVRVLGFGTINFDGDEKADAAVYRPSTGTWFSLDSSASLSSYRYRGWGLQAQGDVPVPGDFDGDGIVDPTVFRPATGTWFVLRSSTAFTTFDAFGWGAPGDTPVPGDYDGDGKADAAVYRPATGTWFIRPSSGATVWNVGFGKLTDLPVEGDFDGDGKRDPAVYRSSTGTWFYLTSSSGFTAYVSRGWGVDAQGDVPAPGDFDGDGKTDPCVFRPSTGSWYILSSQSSYTTWSWIGWGTTGDQVAPADYDDDGRADAAVYRTSTGVWYIRPSSGAGAWSVVFGAAGDTPLVTIR